MTATAANVPTCLRIRKVIGQKAVILTFIVKKKKKDLINDIRK